MADVISGGIIDGMAPGTRAKFIGSFNELVMVQKQLKKQMDAFVQVAESILNDIKDKNDYEAFQSYLAPYYQLREPSSMGELSSIGPHSTDAEIKLAMTNLKLAFQTTNNVFKKQKTAFIQTATQKDKFQQLMLRLMGKKGFFGFGSFESVMNKHFKAALNKGLVTNNDVPLPWFLSNMIKPVQMATKYPLLLANLNEIAENAALSKFDVSDKKNIADAHASSVNMVVEMNQAVRLSEQMSMTPKLIQTQEATQEPKAKIVEKEIKKPEVAQPKQKPVIADDKPKPKPKPKPKESSVRTPQFFDDRKHKRRHSSSSSSHSKKSGDMLAAKGHRNTAQVLRLINLLYPKKTNLRVIEKIRKLASDPNADHSQMIIDLAKEEIRSHKPMFSSTSQRDHTVFRQFLREISSGMADRIEAHINRIEQNQLEVQSTNRK